MLKTLNLYSAVSQLYLTKLEAKFKNTTERAQEENMYFSYTAANVIPCFGL